MYRYVSGVALSGLYQIRFSRFLHLTMQSTSQQDRRPGIYTAADVRKLLQPLPCSFYGSAGRASEQHMLLVLASTWQIKTDYYDSRTSCLLHTAATTRLRLTFVPTWMVVTWAASQPAMTEARNLESQSVTKKIDLCFLQFPGAE